MTLIDLNMSFFFTNRQNWAAVHLRHVDVEEDEVGAGLALQDDRGRLLGVGRVLDLEPLRLELLPEEPGDDLRVVHDEHAPARARARR